MATKTLSWIPILLLVLVVCASGCTNTKTAGKGVIIEAFEPDHPEIYSGEPVVFRLLVRNTGSVEARNVHAELLGIDEDWCCKPAGTPEEKGRWLNREKLPNEEECRYNGEGFSLAAPDPSMGTSGGTHTCTWSYRAPTIERGFSLTYRPTARVFYTYSTTTTKLITFGSSAELRIPVSYTHLTLPTKA